MSASTSSSTSLGTAYLLAASDLWLAVILGVWLAAYVALIAYYVPRLGKVGEAQADARAQMTGRIVDSYTNIQTVKLFAHTTREHAYAREAMDEFLQTVNRQGRMFTLTVNSPHRPQFAAAGRGRRRSRIYGWQRFADDAWRDHGGDRPRHAPSPHVAVDLCGRSPQLFESIGTVQDGMTHAVEAGHDRRQAGRAGPRRDARRDPLRSCALPLRARRTSKVIEDFTLTIKPGEKVGAGRPLGRRQVDARQPAARFYDLEGGRILIDGQDIAERDAGVASPRRSAW